MYIFKLASLQLSSNSYFNSDFAIQEISVYPERGLIFDRNGQLLVANQPMYDLIIIPENTIEFDTIELSNLITSGVLQKFGIALTIEPRILKI